MLSQTFWQKTILKNVDGHIEKAWCLAAAASETPKEKEVFTSFF